MTEKEFTQKWKNVLETKLKDFPKEYLGEKEFKVVEIPSSKLILGDELFGRIEIIDSNGSCLFYVDNIQQAKYYLYAVRTNPKEIKIPSKEEDINEMIKSYERDLDKYLKEIETDYKKTFPGHKESIPEGAYFENVDLLNYDELKSAIAKYEIESAIHFASFAYVGESVEDPKLYYINNVMGSINLINALKENNIYKIVFSSTCSLYGNPEIIPISENESLKPINPYAKTKYMIEQVLSDYDTSFNLKYAALRYFNAAGADFSGNIGESHAPEPHLIPIVLNTALGKRDKVFIFGDDYPTNDGTCIRDYIHVNDLADAHIKALEHLYKGNESLIVNLGTGNGYSVKEIIDAAQEITGKTIKTEITGRRAGDPAVLVADNKKAKEVLGWNPKYGLKEIIQSAWKWHQEPKY